MPGVILPHFDVVFATIPTGARRHQHADCKRTDSDKPNSAVAESRLAGLKICLHLRESNNLPLLLFFVDFLTLKGKRCQVIKYLS